MRKIRFAIVGCGRIAERHAEQISRIGILNAVCDIVESRANQFGEKYGAAVYTDYDTMLLNEKDLDVISVCTPNGLHAEHSIKAFRKWNSCLM